MTMKNFTKGSLLRVYYYFVKCQPCIQELVVYYFDMANMLG